MKKLIITAGMPRSGSTWLYNATRLLVESSGPFDIGAGWISDFDTFKHHDIVILKMHYFEPTFVKSASLILYSFRDIRDALASLKRKFNMEPSLKAAQHFIVNDKRWRSKASFIMRYEDMMESPDKILSQLARVLGVQRYNAGKIIDSIGTMNYTSGQHRNDTYNLENLLHRDHITDGRHGSWEGHVSQEIITQIEHECSEWLEQNGYGVTH